ncbi:FAD-binding oxidoreductase [Breoghania sp. L-A4]|uniref:NAD(P)/FAD-dependent oxidoreductase n=1 Tax=Breoghania sp. L-A4 TaxID=2304600 RepID=UPI000E360AF1|nr:FAD-binding oxidoreductase [Breoghania sp. L-A4]AXS40059.1 FAD-binding oxidoreductase [Breoghania sp. L-A4]
MTRLYSPHAYDRSRLVGSYWETTVDPDSRRHAALAEDTHADFAVIGAGFTGLNAAKRLAEAHQADVRVLDAGDPGWGASGRNGGFCCRGGIKLGDPEIARRFGIDEAKRLFHFQRTAIDHVAAILDDNGIDAQRHSHGETALAHRAREFDAFAEEAAFLERNFGVRAHIHPKEELGELGLAAQGFHGGMTVPIGFALNPMRYLTGLATAAARAGARIHGRSPVTRVERADGRWRLSTPQGSLTAKRLIVATNGYTQDDLSPALAGRLLPAVSAIIVTRPISAEDLARQGWTSDQMVYDTRHLLHYFRLMPDGRFLFGMRGALDTAPRDEAWMRRSIERDFRAMFPAWRDVAIDHFWSGLICLARDRSACIGPLGEAPDAWTALGYHGNGVSLGSYSGAIVADLAAGAITPDAIPAPLRGPLRRFPFPALRKAYLRGAYLWYGLSDALPWSGSSNEHPDDGRQL